MRLPVLRCLTLLALLAASVARADDPSELLARCQRSCEAACYELARTLEQQLQQFRGACGSASAETKSALATECQYTAEDFVSTNKEVVARLCSSPGPGTPECIRTAKESVSSKPEAIILLCANATLATAECLRTGRDLVSPQPEVLARLCGGARTGTPECIRAARADVSHQPEVLIRLCSGPTGATADCIRTARAGNANAEAIERQCTGKPEGGPAK
jgi:hypothetical protein